MVFVTLAQDDQIVIIDTEDQDIDDSDCYKGEMTAKLVKQKIKSPNHLLLKSVQLMENMIYILHKIVSFPFTIYHLYRQYGQETVSQYIQIYQ